MTEYIKYEDAPDRFKLNGHLYEKRSDRVYCAWCERNWIEVPLDDSACPFDPVAALIAAYIYPSEGTRRKRIEDVFNHKTTLESLPDYKALRAETPSEPPGVDLKRFEEDRERLRGLIHRSGPVIAREHLQGWHALDVFIKAEKARACVPCGDRSGRGETCTLLQEHEGPHRDGRAEWWRAAR